MLKLLLSSLIAAVSARQICGTCYNAGNKPIFAGSATGGEWKCDAYCDQNMVNAANEVCCVRINILFSRPDISQDESSMAASFVLFFSNHIAIG